MADIPTQPFAATADLEARWHALTDAEKTQAETLIADASQIIVDTCPYYADASTLTLTGVVCAMVKRAMIGADNVGVSSTQQTAGPFNESYNYANPLGDLYLTKAEKQRLGRGVQHAFSIDMSDGSVAA
ncbi:MAG: hypothetical protein ABF747_02305 [Bifidobacterium sp.]|uniref:Phage protein Gp19/Gp15/Gp42 n=1 Tax=Bifidobacterium fermentum TaxID=3059035 RepID=A0AB39UCY9_9BIFI